jgi:hypothetical protein
LVGFHFLLLSEKPMRRPSRLTQVALVATAGAALLTAWIISKQSSPKHTLSTRTSTHSLVQYNNDDQRVRDLIAPELDAEASLQLQAAEMRTHLPQSPMQKERIENISGESISTMIENLANFDDDQFAITSIHGFTYGEPSGEMRRITHLSRVRRLLETGRASADAVLTPLRSALENALPQWPAAREARVKKWKDNPNGFTESEPDEYQKVSVRAMAATYLIAELQDHPSLPLLTRSCRIQLAWTLEYKPYPAIAVPVPPAMALYAMHRLILTYPKDGLDGKSQQALQVYLEWAENNIAPPNTATGTSWMASHDASDPMVLLGDPKKVLLKAQPKITYTRYPYRYKDGTPVQPPTEQDVGERGATWFKLMDAFVSSLPKPTPEK